MPDIISPTGLYLIMTGMLVFGSANTLVLKWQDETISDCNGFTHPYFQGMVMFLGEFFCWVFFFCKKIFFKSDKLDNELQQAAALKRRPTKINPLWLAIPATCDFMASTLMFIALTMVPASVY
jgi:hypothetical protein